MKIFYADPTNPFKINPRQIITPICTRGYTGALVIKLVLQQLVGINNVRDQYGISADPKFVFNDPASGDSSMKIIAMTDVATLPQFLDPPYQCDNDEFEKVFGFPRSNRVQNSQTKIIRNMNMQAIVGYNESYCAEIKNIVWNFATELDRVFILMTVADREINAAIANLDDNDTLVIFRSYNEVAYPINGAKAFSVDAYMGFIRKVLKCFVVDID